MVAQQHGLARAERLRHAGTHLSGTDQIDGVGVIGQAVGKADAGLADRTQRPARCREGDRVDRVGVDHAAYVRTCLEDFRVDVHLAVAPSAAADLLAFEVADDDVVHGDFVEAMAVRLHVEQRRVRGVAHREVAARQIAESLRFQDRSGVDELLLRLLRSHDVSLTRMPFGVWRISPNAACCRRWPAPGCAPAPAGRARGSTAMPPSGWRECTC